MKEIGAEERGRQREFINKIYIKNQNAEKKPLALVETYGCAQNESDSERLRGMLADMGYDFCSDVNSADLILYNTCAVRENAELRVLGNIGAVKHLKEKKPSLIIGACGCMMQQEHMAETIRTRYQQVDMVFGTHALYRFPEILDEVMSRGRVFDTENDDGAICEGISCKRDGGITAKIPIMYGCNNFCSYCIVPYVRGRERSRSVENILDEVRSAAKEGYKEVMLLGQNVNSYNGELTFAELLRAVCRIDGIERVRFMTSHPKDVSDELIAAIAEEDKICKQLHLPVQCGSDRILKVMNRKYTRESYLETVKKVRAAVPDVVLTSDIIVGFPGETNEDFEETMSLLAAAEYDMVFSFIYSKRKGTPAAEMDDCLTEEEKHRNFERMLKLQDEISRRKNEKYVGRYEEVLVESVSRTNNEFMSGRTSGGKIVNFRGDGSMTGKILKVKITEAKTWSLVGEIENR